MFLYIFLIFAIIVLLLFLSMVWPPDSPWAPNWGTSRKIAEAQCLLAKVTAKDLIYDLGSGGGLALITAAKKFGAKGVGVEIDPARYFISKFRVWRENASSKALFKRANLFNEDLTPATVIFVYLVPKTLNRLIPKFKKELKKGTRIVSFRYEMNLPLKKVDKKNKLFLYII